MAAALEQRHLAEEIALLQHRLLVGGDLNHGLAAGDQIHRITGVAFAHDGNARKEHARIDQISAISLSSMAANSGSATMLQVTTNWWRLDS